MGWTCCRGMARVRYFHPQGASRRGRHRLARRRAPAAGGRARRPTNNHAEQSASARWSSSVRYGFEKIRKGAYDTQHHPQPGADRQKQGVHPLTFLKTLLTGRFHYSTAALYNIELIEKIQAGI